jgi:hypothetical protein
MTARQLADIKQVSPERMNQLIKSYGIDGAMQYDKDQARQDKKRRYELDGEKYTIKELCEMAKSPCTVGRMANRIKEYGIRMAVDFDDFEQFKRNSGKGKHKMVDPIIPEHSPEEHFITNLTESLKMQGYDDKQIQQEVLKRWAA